MSARSFPSGHSSESMAGTLYVTLICWADLSRYPGANKGWRRSLLVSAEAIIEIFPFLPVYCNVLKDIFFLIFFVCREPRVFCAVNILTQRLCCTKISPWRCSRVLSLPFSRPVQHSRTVHDCPHGLSFIVDVLCFVPRFTKFRPSTTMRS